MFLKLLESFEQFFTLMHGMVTIPLQITYKKVINDKIKTYVSN